MSTLLARGLGCRLGGRTVLEDLDLSVAAGEVVGLLGPNGAGKTTAFRIIAGLLPRGWGEVLLDGRPLRGALHRRVRLGLGYLPQESALLGGLPVRQQLLVPLRRRGAPSSEADRLLAEAGLAGRARAAVETLSGGERRRLEIARCLAGAPRVVLLDEPFAGVDPLGVADLAGRVRALARGGLGVLLTDHAVREAMRLCDRVVLLDRGRVILRGDPGEVALHPEARQRWLGEDFETGLD